MLKNVKSKLFIRYKWYKNKTDANYTLYVRDLQMLVYVDEKLYEDNLNSTADMEFASNAYAFMGPVAYSISFGFNSIETDISLDVHFSNRVTE